MGNAKFSHLIDWRNHNKDIKVNLYFSWGRSKWILGTPMAVKYKVDFNSSLCAWKCVFPVPRKSKVTSRPLFSDCLKVKIILYSGREQPFSELVVTAEIKISLSTQSKLSRSWSGPKVAVVKNLQKIISFHSFFHLFIYFITIICLLWNYFNLL